MNVKLADIRIEDASTIAKWKSDPQLSEQIMSVFQPTSIDQAKRWIETNSNHSGQVLKGIYISENVDLILIGVARLMFIDSQSRNAEFGIYIGNKQYLGKGLGEIAMNLILTKGFKELDLLKIYLKVAENNKPAVNLYKKLNFQTEGCLKEHYYHEGKFENIIFMSLFREDYL